MRTTHGLLGRARVHGPTPAQRSGHTSPWGQGSTKNFFHKNPLRCRAHPHERHTFCIRICRERGDGRPSSNVALWRGSGCGRGRPGRVCAGESHGAALGLLAVLHGLKQPGRPSAGRKTRALLRRGRHGLLNGPRGYRAAPRAVGFPHPGCSLKRGGGISKCCAKKQRSPGTLREVLST